MRVTAVLELVRLFFCEHVKTLPEAAGIVFSGRFPRNDRPPLRQAAQRAIYHIQRELESVAETENAAVVLCDRGTVDCAAYWTGEGDLYSAVSTTRASELARYDAVIHLVRCRNLLTPRDRTRESLHPVDPDVGPECRSNR